MAKKTKKSLETKHNEVSVPAMYSNDIGIAFSDDEVILNFSISAPSHFEPHDVTETPVARIALLWDAAEGLMELLQRAVARHKEKPKKRKAKSKAVREVR